MLNLLAAIGCGPLPADETVPDTAPADPAPVSPGAPAPDPAPISTDPADAADAADATQDPLDALVDQILQRGVVMDPVVLIGGPWVARIPATPVYLGAGIAWCTGACMTAPDTGFADGRFVVGGRYVP
jgi:hypothetical protein